VSAVVALIAGRARAYASQWALVAVGVAIATSVPVLTSASTRVASVGALEHGIAALPAGQRSLTVSYYGFLSGTDLAKADAVVRRNVGRLTQAAPLREMVFRRLSDSRGGQLTLAAVDDLPRAVRLVSGRLPTSCTPQRCEVVQVGSGATAYTAKLGVVIVGRVERVNPFLLSGTFDPGADAPLLLGANTQQMAASSILENFFRTWGWVAPLDLQLVGRLGVEHYLARGNDVADALFRTPPGLVLTAPDDVLRDEDDRASRSGQRFALLGGTSAALVLGLAVVAAVSARRDHLAVIRLLLTRGATPAQLTGFSVAEAIWPSLVGAAAGVAGAYVAALAFWDSSVAAAGLTGGLPTSALLAAAAVAAVGLTLRWSPAAGERAAWQAVNVAVVATVAAALLAASRGSTGVETGASPDALVTLLPVLSSLAGGLLAARCWPFVPRLLARLAPRRAAGFRLALADAGRRPLRAAATVAVLAATSASVVFAIGYRTTLDRGAEDQAAYSVPMLARLTTGPSLVRPADLAAGAGVNALGPGATAYPVLRDVASLSVSSVDSAAVELLGLAPSALPRVSHWRSDYANATPRTLQQRLTTAAPVHGPAIPDATRTLVVPAAGSTAHLDVIALVRDASGRSLPITLARRGDTVVGALPRGSRRTLDSISLREDVLSASLRQHAVGESGLDLPARTGRVVFGQPTADGQALPGDVGGWSVTTPGRGVRTSTGLAIDYRIAGDTTTARPPRPARGPVPAYVDSASAAQAHAGLLSLRLSDGRQLPLRVVAAGARFPTTHGRFAVVDRASLATALDDMVPGAGTATEVWLWAPTGNSTRDVTKGLHRLPFDQLAVALRPAEEQSLRSDPVALTSSRLLLGTALVGLLVGGLCVVLMVLAERRESAGELFAREADGTRPGRLRVELLARAGAVLAVGVPVGVGAGIVLARATTTLVTVTAGGTTPEPPLVDAASPALVAAALVALLGLGLLGAAGVAAASLRGPLPVPPGTDLR
jgi:hypothetical protein